MVRISEMKEDAAMSHPCWQTAARLATHTTRVAHQFETPDGDQFAVPDLVRFNRRSLDELRLCFSVHLIYTCG